MSAEVDMPVRQAGKYKKYFIIFRYTYLKKKNAYYCVQLIFLFKYIKIKF